MKATNSHTEYLYNRACVFYLYTKGIQYLTFADQIRISLVLELARDRTGVRRDEVND